MKNVMKDIFLNVQYLKNLHELHGDLKCLYERKKIKNVENILEKRVFLKTSVLKI